VNLAFGSFSGDPVTRWLCDGRNMQLVEDFSYTDPAGKVWSVPAGFITDGASIPKCLWSAVGGPFEGVYRNASIPHDYVCKTHTTIEERRLGDLMFRSACLCAGCSEDDANRLYAGVSIGTLEEQIRSHNATPISPAPDPPNCGN
jgi:hypothetical protein